jgi:hypothetical protein
LIDLEGVDLPAIKPVLKLIGPWLSRLLKFDELNAIHDQVIETASAEHFFSRTLQILGASYEVAESDLDRIPAQRSRRHRVQPSPGWPGWHYSGRSAAPPPEGHQADG